MATSDQKKVTAHGFSIEPVPTGQLGEYNTNRHYEWTPFSSVSDKIIAVDFKWWSEFIRIAPRSFVLHLLDSKSVVALNKVPHKSQMHIPMIKSLLDVYHECHNYRNFSTMQPNPHILIPIGKYDLATLISWGRIKLLSDRSPSDDEIGSWLTAKFLNQIGEFCTKHAESGVFVKTGFKSAKNDQCLHKPLVSVHDVIRHVISSRDVVSDLQQSHAEHLLVLLKWMPIRKEQEVRVIVLDKKVTGISQQFCYAVQPGLESLLTNQLCLRLLVDFVNDLVSHWTFSDTVVDIWIESESKFHLIEFNPGGAWSSSGSALFHWIEDQSRMKSDQPIPVRFVVK